MEIPLNIEVVFLGTAITQGVFAFFLLNFQKNNLQANRYLSLLVLFFSLWLLDTFFRVAYIYQQDPNYYFLPIYFSLAFGPLIFFYTKAVTEKDFSFKKEYWWHFLPALIQASLYIFLQFSNYAFRRWFWFEIHRPFTHQLEFNLSLLSLIIYLYFSTRLLRNYQDWIKNQFSEISKITLNWLRIVLFAMISLALFWLLESILRANFDYYPDHPYSAVIMGFTILIFAAGGLLQEDLKDKGIPHAGSFPNVPIEQIDPIVLDKIIKTIEKQKLFLKPDLTLAAFAKAVELPARQISFYLNNGLQTPFIDFVNKYRVEKVKSHIEKNDLPHLTLLGIAYESGFSSKSTFNRVFKKFTQKSPSEYQKDIQNRS